MPWSRSTARSWPCVTSRSSATARSAQVLGLSKSAASNRYIRALERLKEILKGIPGFLEN